MRMSSVAESFILIQTFCGFAAASSAHPRPPPVPARVRPTLIHKAALAPRGRPRPRCRRPRRRPPVPDEGLRRRGSALRNVLRNGQGECEGETGGGRRKGVERGKI